MTWVAGLRLDHRKEMLQRSARDYLRQVQAAQSVGAVIPELSEALRELMTESGHEPTLDNTAR
jgi:hypothetical protein